ncbi:aminoacyl-tRNA hydrolase [Desulfobacterales bacterium HSG17]|nr:aminoacyl-tRNA hydrolase [Desulfobacterales bacterium HSG17]
MPQNIRLIAGLGNPGIDYEKTRHNIGFIIIDELSRYFSIPFTGKRFGALTGHGFIEDIEVFLVKPIEFMNRSGPPVYLLSKYMGICIRDIIVIHDDMDLDYGRIKIKEKGGYGGHKGIKSLIDTFEGDDFVRLRMGIGRPDPEVNVIDHVLGRFDPDKEKKTNQLFTQAREAIVTILCKGTKEGMNAFNRKILIV